MKSFHALLLKPSQAFISSTKFALAAGLSYYQHRSTTSISLSPSKQLFKRVTCAQLSSPFPQPDSFSVPQVAFPSALSADLRPELLGALLWTAALYLGFSQSSRWADDMRKFLTKLFEKGISHDSSVLLADIVHTLPFLFAGLALDAFLRVVSGGAVWAIATGTTAALYAGIYELIRQAIAGNRISKDDTVCYDAFVSFADRRLQSRGMCHFIDIRNAIVSDSKTSATLRRVSDGTMRRFLKKRFPKARRSPNGFYRGLSVQDRKDISKSSNIISSDNESNNLDGI